MNINEIKYGFKLVSVREMKDINSTLFEYEHIKSGGKLAYLANEDTNNCFAIGFKTIPTDSTGICHIIEHSVLCGSDKYPLKEPFVNLLKSSLATFLNAMTASDWTMYPVASQTPKDFTNLMSVYLDAVFNPLSIKDPKPFLQEGWHYELNSEDEIPSYKGVVYNEMKGAMSSVDEQLMMATREAMYDENCTYHYNSGGDPEKIIDLTFDQYKAFHKKHYTPQNAMTYLYGKMDVEEKLKFIDEEYFSKFDKTDEKIIINRAKDVIDTSYVKEYEIGEDEEVKDNTYMSLCYDLDDSSNYESLLAMKILVSTLLSNNDQVLKKALLDAHLGQDVSASIDDDCIVPALYVNLEKTNIENKEAFKKLFEDEVKKLVTNGIDKESLIATINSTEFSLKELDTGRLAKGLVFAFDMMQCFDYDMDLASRLEFSKYFDKFRKELNNNYFEKLLEKLILNSKHNVEVAIVPSKTLAAKKKEEMDAKMKAFKESMSKEEVKALVKQTKDLIAYQNHVDTKKELATLPSLKIKDVPSTINYLETKKLKVNGFNCISHDLSTNKIAYMRMYFNTNCLTLEEQPYVLLLTNLLRSVNTTKYDVTKLNNTIKTYLGSFMVYNAPISKSKDDTNNYVVVSVSSLLNNTSYIPDIVNEVLLHSKFTKKETMQIVQQLANACKQSMIQNGRGIAVDEALSHYSTNSALARYTSFSLVTQEFFNNLLKETNFNNISRKLKEVASKLFNKQNVLVSISGDVETRESLIKVLKNVKLPRRASEVKLEINLTSPTKEALIIPSGVSYCVLGNNINNFNTKYDGKFVVLSHIAVLDYLWPEVRVKGGAYGQSLVITPSTGDVVLTSYRDPNCENTYKVFRALPEYLRNFKVSSKEFTNYIIGAMSKFDSPMSNPSLINTWDMYYMKGITKKDRILVKKQALKTKIEDINAFADLFEKIVNVNVSEYTVGNADKIKEHNFDKTSNLQ